jgi:hypothetical protein
MLQPSRAQPREVRHHASPEAASEASERRMKNGSREFVCASGQFAYP